MYRTPLTLFLLLLVFSGCYDTGSTHVSENFVWSRVQPFARNRSVEGDSIRPFAAPLDHSLTATREQGIFTVESNYDFDYFLKRIDSLPDCYVRQVVSGPDYIYAVTDQGVLRSHRDISSSYAYTPWHLIINDTGVAGSVAFHTDYRQSGGRVLTLTIIGSNALYRIKEVYSDIGLNSQGMADSSMYHNLPLPIPREFHDVHLTGNRDTLFVAALYPEGNGAFAVSLDGGLTWERRSLPESVNNIQTITCGPLRREQDHDTPRKFAPIIQGSDSIYMSADFGVSWNSHPLPPGTNGPIAADNTFHLFIPTLTGVRSYSATSDGSLHGGDVVSGEMEPGEQVTSSIYFSGAVRFGTSEGNIYSLSPRRDAATWDDVSSFAPLFIGTFPVILLCALLVNMAVLPPLLGRIRSYRKGPRPPQFKVRKRLLNAALIVAIAWVVICTALIILFISTFSLV